MQHVIVGTAGHIDHGKSSLVLALTGTDPDRLREEKERGITIDLGFAHTTEQDTVLSFVDVPGHERFVRNMLAGVGGMDLVMLHVASDESVMPQTREHFEICRFAQGPRRPSGDYQDRSCGRGHARRRPARDSRSWCPTRFSKVLQWSRSPRGQVRASRHCDARSRISHPPRGDEPPMGRRGYRSIASSR
jgi:hypothetical protein